MITESGLRYLVNLREGQKTGFFLDQRDKRMALRKYCRDSRVLNCFSYTGGFTLAALAGEARHVTSVDSSASALELAKENVKLNSFDLSRCEFVTEDVKQYLRKLKRGSHDIIVLDPPAFIKDRRKKKEGMAGYRSIAEGALRALEPGSILVTCSCSAHLTMDEFRHLLSEAALRTATPVRVIESFTHGLDHPVLSGFPEGEYLKCLFAAVG
jgi:23S rRNA (cytosine1962-C5)-methyltransferase